MRTALANGAGMYYTCNPDITVYIADDLQDLKLDAAQSNSLIIIDEDLIVQVRQKKLQHLIEGSDNYYLIFDRNALGSVQTNVNAIFELENKCININNKNFVIHTTKLAFGLIRPDVGEHNIDKFKYLITEDTQSGELFWKEIFCGITLVKCDPPGNSGVFETLLRVLDNDPDANVIIALDYDEGSLAMSRLYDYHIHHNLSNIVFIPLESFEEVIYNSEFILSKFPEMREEVLNYKEHIDSTYKHTGKYFSTLLHKYVKVKPPIAKQGKHNITKFYTKGMKNFKECFKMIAVNMIERIVN